MKIRIITDSASDLPSSFRDDLTVLPMTVSFNDRQYLDGVNLSHREFFEKLIEEDTLPVTSQINPAQFVDAFRAAVLSGETVVAITMSSKLSGTCQSAMIAAQEFPRQVWVVDSENASFGEAILVKRAFQLMETGLDAEAIAEQLNREKKEIRLIALLDTLEYLKRGGRLSAQAAFVGGVLSIKPVIAIREGEVRVLGKARGSRNGNNLLVKEIRNTNGIDFQKPFLLAYSGLNDELLQKYIADSQQLWKGQTTELPVTSIGGTIGTHVGPGAVGVAFFQKETET